MFIGIRALAVSTFLAMAVSCPQVSAAEAFTSKEFLLMSEQSQSGYFQATIGMAALIASKNNKPQADCMERWYFKGTDAAERTIRDAMQRYPGYHPLGIISALLEKQCGSFSY